jgi:hypothetical protein
MLYAPIAPTLAEAEREPQMPPVSITATEYGAAAERIYVHRTGAVRFAHYATALAAYSRSVASV